MSRLGCRSGLELFRPDGELVVTRPSGEILRAERGLDDEKRRELIKALRAGEHVELTIKARTFRQKDGSPNRNYLRFAPAILSSLAASFVGMPVLLDHNKHAQRARIGTITESVAVPAGGWVEFLQTLHVVKPDAVISVLDGTLDRFSIGWAATGPVLCTVHKTDVRGRGACTCWPGDRVTLEGVEHVVEFEFASAAGVETSAVNVPAVSGTRIEEVRQSLSAELGLRRASHDDAEREEPIAPGLAAVAAQLGLDPQELADHARRLRGDGDHGLESVAHQLGYSVDELRDHAAGMTASPRARLERRIERDEYPVHDDGLENVARQLGLDVDELRDHADALHNR